HEIAGAAQPSLAEWLQQRDRHGSEEEEEVPGASDHSALVRKDFASFASADLEEIGRIAERLARKLAARPGRRWASARRGPRIGAGAAAFSAEWPRLVDRRTVVVIWSGGWDGGDPAERASALEVLEARCRRLVWLNRLVGSPGYEPLARGMQAALSHVSVF